MEISLIPKQQESKLKLKSIFNYFPVAAVAIILVVLYGVLLLQKKSLDKNIIQARSEFNQNESIIKKEFGVGSYALADKINNLSQVLSSRLYWSNFIGRTPKIFNSDVTIKGYTLDLKNFKISVSGSTPTYSSLQKQLDDLKNNKEFVQDSSLAESSFSENSIVFKINITFKRDILKSPYSL